MPLPPDATPRSHELLPLAVEIAGACPIELGIEIGLAGSVARGWADEHSDIELNLWVESLDGWPQTGFAWAESIGAEKVHQYEAVHPNGSIWLEFDYKGAPVEAGWHAISHCDALLRRVVAGEVDDMFQGYLAESLVHSIPLRDGENQRRWSSWLVEYPEAVRTRMIESAVQGFRTYPRWFELDRAFLLRPEPALITRRIEGRISSCIRILFAINRQWEPDTRKWIARWAETLDIKPERFAERVYAIYRQPLSAESYRDVLELISETLALVPDEYDVTDVREMIVWAKTRWAT